MSITALKSAKKSLRTSMAKTLRDLTQSDVQSQSEAIVAKVVALPAFKRSKTISCYLSMPSGEAQTKALVSNILADNDAGKKLFVPTLASKDGQMDFVRLYDDEDLQALPAGLWGIPEPPAEWRDGRRQRVSDESCEDLDLVVLPGQRYGLVFHEARQWPNLSLTPPLTGVAFDSSLSRLGHGKGYYDRFISSYANVAKRPRPLLVALSLQQQLLEAGQIPMADYDWKVDIIVTPDAVITREDLV